MKVLLASFEPRRDRDPDRLTLRSKANPHREQQAVIEPADQDSGRYEPKLHAHDSIHQADMAYSQASPADQEPGRAQHPRLDLSGRSICALVRRDAVEPPCSGNAFEFVFPLVAELDV